MPTLEERLKQIPRRLERLRKEGREKISVTVPESRFLHDRKGFTLGYTAKAAVSEDHFILETKVTQANTDNPALLPTAEAVERRCRERSRKVSADSGFFKLEAIRELAQRRIDAYVPDSTLAQELNLGKRAQSISAGPGFQTSAHAPEVRDPVGGRVYARRK